MLFSEVYGAYYETVSLILKEALEGTLTQARLRGIVQSNAFAESMLTIPQKLNDGSWPLLTRELEPVISHAPERPMTLLQKRWLKALLTDPRIRLFDVNTGGLEDVEPLFTQAQFVYYDRYADGDPYEDEAYIARFRTILEAIRTGRRLLIDFDSGHGKRLVWTVIPYRLEYSSVDDKFRLIAGVDNGRKIRSINLKRIRTVTLREPFNAERHTEPVIPNMTLVFELTDERNTLERAMLQFSYLAKETVRLDDKHYRVSLHYRQEDETELVIKLLSFGPLIRVTGPDRITAQIRERIQKQMTRGVP